MALFKNISGNRKHNKSINTWAFVALVILLPCIIYPIFIWCETKLTVLPVLGPSVGANHENKIHTVPAFSFTNQQGRLVSSTQWKNKIMVADFIFTHCAVVCPRMTSNLKTVQDAFVNDSSVQLVSFTVDPERDSSVQLKKYADKYGINARQWQLLTGTKQSIYRLARNGFIITATDGDGGPDDFIHSEKIVLVDKQQQIRGFYTGTDKSEIETLITDIKKLQDETE